MGVKNFLYSNVYMKIIKSSSKRYIAWLRSKGVSIGNGCMLRYPNTIRIDVSRPSLVTIGNNVDMNMNFQILTHDWSSLVFRECFGDLVNSSGKVSIGSNVYFGANVIVLKGVSIGDNCIIGAGSVVSKDIPSNSVAVGVPCRVVSSLEDYYKKRKRIALGEAVEYVKSIQERFGRNPFLSEMREEFIYFTNEKNYESYEKQGVPIRFQLGSAFEQWLRLHANSEFEGFEDFLNYVKQQKGGCA